MSSGQLIAIAGPTAIGKTSLSIQIAKELNTEIISADSRQFYKEMSIGTAKPTKEEMKGVKHHFVDNLSLQDGETMNAGKYAEEVLELLSRLFAKHPKVLMVGGSGLFIQSVCHGFDSSLPEKDQEIRNELEERLKFEGIESLQNEVKEIDPNYYDTADIHNPKRLIRAIEVFKITGKPYSTLRTGASLKRPFDIIKIGLEIEREQLYKRINGRVDKMIELGLEEEARGLLPYRELNALQTVGYTEFFDYFDGKMTKEEAIEKIKVNTRRYAKRQLTWFKKDKEFQWFNPEDKQGLVEILNS